MIDNTNSMPAMYDINEKPFGKSWEEWTAKWWQWFFSTPIENHPAYDKTGENSGLVNQLIQMCGSWQEQPEVERNVS